MTERLDRLRDTGRRWFPLTEAGRVVTIGAVVSFLMGWLLGWTELSTVAAACLIALLIGVGFVVRRYRLDLHREIQPDRVVVGEPSFGLLEVHNPTALPSLPLRVEDKVGDGVLPIDLPALAPGKSHETLYPLPTDKRGVLKVGPVVIPRTDPLRLFRSEVTHSETDTLWVHPRHHVLKALPAGFAKDYEGPTSQSSPKGDVAFHALREYVHGDDYRHIHWRSSARLSRLMVRQYVDNRQPKTAVVLEPSAVAFEEGDFEVAVEIAASVAISAMLARHPVALFMGDRLIAGTPLGSTTDGVLDALSLVEPSPDTLDPTILGTAMRRFDDTSVLVYVTGPIEPHALLAHTASVRRTVSLVVARCWNEAPRRVAHLPDARLIDLETSEEFKAAWNRLAG